MTRGTIEWATQFIMHVGHIHLAHGLVILVINKSKSKAYSAIRSRYDDILRGSDNLSAILKTPEG